MVRPRPGETEESGRIARIFDGYAAAGGKQRAWSSTSPGNAAIRAELAAAILAESPASLWKGARALDVGCGTGWWLEHLARAGLGADRLHGVELLERRAEAAAQRVTGADARTADARHLPFPTGHFGLVTLLVVLSSLPDRDAVRSVLLEAARVTAAQGVIVVWDVAWPTPNRATRTPGATEVESPLRAGGRTVARRSITLAPPVARHLGALTGRLYPRLAALPVLRSHRLTVARGADHGTAGR